VPTRTKYAFDGIANNVQGYNEDIWMFNHRCEVGFRKTASSSGSTYIMEMPGAWLVVGGVPTQNKYWFKSEDHAVRLAIIRGNGSADTVSDERLCAAIWKHEEELVTLPLSGYVSIENTGQGYVVYLNVESEGVIPRNEMWLEAMRRRMGDGIELKRIDLLPGDLAKARIKGSIFPQKVFTGW
jgi:hypothetical protein